MHPAFSVISFTTLLGAAQGFIVTLAIIALTGEKIPHLVGLLAFAIGLLIVSLAASFFHLGHPERAWRAMAMWRTSWLSREVIILPAFIGLTTLWAVFEWMGIRSPWLILVVIAVSAALWVCTAMIYACIKFIAEWAHPITIANYFLLGIASGLTLTVSLFALIGAAQALIAKVAIWAAVATLIAAGVRWMSIKRNAALKPKSTVQSATGIHHPRVVQKSMGMSAGAFNTREFFHGKSEFFVRHIKKLMAAFCFGLPVLLLLLGVSSDSGLLLAIAFPAQYLGLLAERWLFFAQARHPQNIYYQTVS